MASKRPAQPDGVAQPDPDAATPQQHITAYWDLRSSTYDAQPRHGIRTDAERQAWHGALQSLLPPAPADVLDVGAGTGFLALLLAELGHRVIGVDLSEGMLDVARASAATLPGTAGHPQFQVGDAMAPPLPPRSVDVVTSRHLVWTLTDPRRAFESWRRLLRPGGRVVAIDGLWRLRSRGTGQESQAPSDAPRGGQPPAPAAASCQEAWGRHYSAAVQAALPLFDTESLDAVVAAARSSGFKEVRVLDLAEVEKVERAIEPDQPPRRPRYVLVAEQGE